jgi:FeS assembly SUF system protein
METKPSRVPLELEQPNPASSEKSHPGSCDRPSPPGGRGVGGEGEPVDIGELRDKVIDALRTCFDPEIPVNIYELGLIYGIDISPEGTVQIRMTLTSPGCPVAGSLPPEVQAKVGTVPGVAKAAVELVWDPPWNQDRMSEAARLQLGFF